MYLSLKSAMHACMVSTYVVYQCSLTPRYRYTLKRTGLKTMQILVVGEVDTFTTCETTSVQVLIHNLRR